jgi:hypothetical protein
MDRDQPRHTVGANLGLVSGTGTCQRDWELSVGLGLVRLSPSCSLLRTPSHFPAKSLTKAKRRRKFTVPYVPTPQSLQIGTFRPQSLAVSRPIPRSLPTPPFSHALPFLAHIPAHSPVRLTVGYEPGPKPPHA